MKSKWFIGSLFVILILLGVGRYQNSTPNQQIVLQFNSNQVTDEETQTTISLIEEELKTAGIFNTQIIELSHGKLAITYYSDYDVLQIKDILSKNKRLVLRNVPTSSNGKPLQNPENDEPTSINLDVYEIQSNNDIDFGKKGFVFRLKPEKDRSLNPNTYLFVDLVSVNKRSSLERTINFYNDVFFENNNTSHKIPEVRAGPIA